jgi:hypothetical protein
MAESKSTSQTTQKTSEQSGSGSNDPDTLAEMSRDAEKSEYKKNTDTNPDDVYPAPGPSTIQELGKP